MASRTTEKQTKRTTPYSITRRKRSLKNARVSNQESSKVNPITNPPRSTATETSASTTGHRVLTPREQVLAAYASVYVPTTDHVQAPVLKRLSGLRGVLTLSSQLVTVAANLIQAHWETTATLERLSPNHGDQGQAARSMHLTGYISTILARASMLQMNSNGSLSPSFSTIALVFALVYVERLKKLHPNARGEAGCGHRLFLVSYMVASKYLQGHVLARSEGAPHKHTNSQTPDTRGSVSQESVAFESSSVLPSIILPNEQWARLSGVFSTPELTRMELELLAFLQFDLHVSYEDFIYHWTKYMDINQLVPNQRPSVVSPHNTCEESEDEGIVPEF